MRCLFVLVLYIFSLGRKAHRSMNRGVNSLKNVDFFPTPTPVNTVSEKNCDLDSSSPIPL